LFAISHLHIQEIALLGSIQKSSKFFQEIMTIVSSAGIMDTDKVLIEGATSFL
jgi:hypothetical protein